MSREPAAQLNLLLEPGPGINSEELDLLTRQLRDRLQELPVESVRQITTGPGPAGAKVIDAALLGGLAINLAPSLLPKAIDLVATWLGQDRARNIKIKTQVGNRSVELEYSPKLASPDELQHIVERLAQGLAGSSSPAMTPGSKAAPEPGGDAFGPPARSAQEDVRRALVIGTSEFQDPKLAKLTAPAADVQDFASVLRDPQIGAFQVQSLINAPLYTIQREIARFFKDRLPEDLLLLYISGHGVRDNQGRLYLAATDTDYSLLSGTALPAAFITNEMDQSRSRRQVLVLDCCHSGAFAQGAKGVPGESVGTASAFEGLGYGRIVLTASDATQYAWEGDKVIGQAQNSLFTHFLIQGLLGEADTEGDGRITVDELYDYAYTQVIRLSPNQVPGKWSYRQQGDIVLARNPAVQAAALPPELQQAISSPLSTVRQAAVHELEPLLKSSSLGVQIAARQALTALSTDDSRKVAAAAELVLSGSTAGIVPNAPPRSSDQPEPVVPAQPASGPAKPLPFPARQNQTPAVPSTSRPSSGLQFGETLGALRRVSTSRPSRDLFVREGASVHLLGGLICVTLSSMVAGMLLFGPTGVIVGPLVELVLVLGWALLLWLAALALTRVSRFRTQLYLQMLVWSPCLVLASLLFHVYVLLALVPLLYAMGVSALAVRATLERD